MVETGHLVEIVRVGGDHSGNRMLEVAYWRWVCHVESHEHRFLILHDRRPTLCDRHVRSAQLRVDLQQDVGDELREQAIVFPILLFLTQALRGQSTAELAQLGLRLDFAVDRLSDVVLIFRKQENGEPNVLVQLVEDVSLQCALAAIIKIVPGRFRTRQLPHAFIPSPRDQSFSQLVHHFFAYRVSIFLAKQLVKIDDRPIDADRLAAGSVEFKFRHIPLTVSRIDCGVFSVG